MKKHLSKYWYWYLGAGIVIYLISRALYLYYKEPNKDINKTLELRSNFMKGPEVCELQELIRENFPSPVDISNYNINDCIFGPDTRDALYLTFGIEKGTLAEIRTIANDA